MQPPFVCQVTLFAFNFAPSGWAPCGGALIPISQNTALYNLLGDAYGGDGQNTFALPDYRGLAPQGMQYCIALQGVWPLGASGGGAVGELALLPYNQITPPGNQLVPQGWVNCNGQLLPIDEFGELFQVIGTTFGGDGETTFGLPNLSAWEPPPSPLSNEGSSLYFISLYGEFGAPSAILCTVQLFPDNVLTDGWAACRGQILSIDANRELYSLLGNMFGGDGKTTFALPDLRQLDVPPGTQYYICISSPQFPQPNA